MGATISGMPQTKQVLISDLEQELDLLKLKTPESVKKVEQPERSLLLGFIPAMQPAKMIGISRPTLQKYSEEGLLKRYGLGTKFTTVPTIIHGNTRLIEAINFPLFTLNNIVI